MEMPGGKCNPRWNFCSGPPLRISKTPYRRPWSGGQSTSRSLLTAGYPGTGSRVGPQRTAGTGCRGRPPDLDPAWFRPGVSVSQCWVKCPSMAPRWNFGWRRSLAHPRGGDHNQRPARYVDGSLERLQIKFQATTGRHRPRQRAYASPSRNGTHGRSHCRRPIPRLAADCLHPGIPVDSPLGVEVYDHWNACTLGRAIYHVAHPETPLRRPSVNAMEAEGRRLQRFSRWVNAGQA